MFSQGEQSQVLKWEAIVNGMNDFKQLKHLLHEIEGMGDEYVDIVAARVSSIVFGKMLGLTFKNESLSFEDIQYVFDYAELFLNDEDKQTLLDKMKKRAMTFQHFYFLFRQVQVVFNNTQKRNVLIGMKGSIGSQKEREIFIALCYFHRCRDIIGLHNGN